MPRTATFSCATAILLAACGPNIRTTYLTQPGPPRRPEAEITVSSVGVPACRFQELGLITIRDTPNLHGSDLLEAMKDEARRIGGHALVGLSQIPKTKGEGAQGLSATIVRFLEPECRG